MPDPTPAELEAYRSGRLPLDRFAVVDQWLAALPAERQALLLTEETPPASPLPLPTTGFQPGSVDHDLVGYWKANVEGGLWILQIAANGTYTFHSAAPSFPGNEPMHNGTFTTSNGKYTMHAISIVFDTQGTYTIQGSSKGTLEMSGEFGSNTWYRTGLDPDP